MRKKSRRKRNRKPSRSLEVKKAWKVTLSDEEDRPRGLLDP
jgi:hypothetical protein